MKINQVNEILEKDDFTVGTRLGEETLYNPYYKCVADQEFDKVLGTSDPVMKFTKIRGLKDNFQG